MYKPGTKVVALLDINAKTKTIRMFGYGEYVGDEIPDENSIGFANLLHQSKVKNPKIVLENGKIVWGCESRWGPVEGFKEKHPTPLWTIQMVDIDAARAESEGRPQARA